MFNIAAFGLRASVKMRGYGSLIRLHAFTLDQIRQELLQLQEAQAGLMHRAEAIDAEVAVEEALASDGHSAFADFSAFLTRQRGAKEALFAQADEIAGQIEAVRAQLAEAFRKKKVFEVLEERRLERIAEEEARQEQAELDEAGVVRHLRKNAS